MQLWVAVNSNKSSVGVRANISYGKMIPGKFYFVVDKMRHNTNVVLFIIDENKNITCMDSEGLDVFCFGDFYDPNTGLDDSTTVPVDYTQETTRVKRGRVSNK